jgi:BirA family biotin operon repressor/biotin-[acetyl-CoA-carboxylase] ligase
MNPTAGSILALLKRSSAHLSGEAIGAELRISRSAVAKQISALRRAGYGIESVPNRGHRLLATADTPLPEEVVPFLRTRSIGRVIRFLDTADSTNAVAAREAAAGATEGTVVVADAQTAGRGRQQREWNSPAGCNLYFSIVLRPTVPPRRIPQISLVAAVAVHRALADIAPAIGFGIKWPNDILTDDGLKVCGILCEGELETDSVRHAIAGIGLNVNARGFPPALRETAVSLRMLTGADTPRPAVLAAVLNRFEEAYTEWQAARDLTPLLPYLERHSSLANRTIEVRGTRDRAEGRVAGLTPEGELILRTGRSKSTTVACGDVHVIGGRRGATKTPTGDR